MSRVIYVDGQYPPFRSAAVHIEDRGHQLADGVCEVLAVVGRRRLDEEPHLARLARSLGELRIPAPVSDRVLKIVLREVVRRDGVEDGIVYLQVTRGVVPRDHAFPKSPKPTLVVTSRRKKPAGPRIGEDGISAITIPDIRWQRCDIKSVALPPNVLGKQRAKDAGAFEAWRIDRDGFVTEGTSTSAWIVTADRIVVTRQADHAIINGVARLAALDIIRRKGCRFVERPFTVAEAKSATDAFLTSTTVDLLPVVSIDGEPVGKGVVDQLSRTLRAGYLAHAAAA